jgi:hypothetical protein
MPVEVKIAPTPATAKVDQGAREWLIDESSRDLFRSLMKPGLPPSSATCNPSERKSAVEADLAGKSETPSRAPSPERPSGNESQFLTSRAFRIAFPLILASLAYTVWLALGPSSDKPSSQSSLVAAPSPKIDTPSPGREMSVANQDTLSLSPTFSVLQVEPGASASQVLALANNTGSELTFEVAVLDVEVRDGKTVYLRAGDMPNSIAASAVLSQRYLNIKPRDKTSLTVTFTVHPQTASRGLLILLKGTDRATFGGTMSLTPTLGSLVTIILPENSAAPIAGTEAGPLSRPVDYAFSQWETVTSTPDCGASKQGAETPGTTPTAVGVAPGSSQGGDQP